MKKAFHRFWFILYDFIAAVLAWNIFYFARKAILEESLHYNQEILLKLLGNSVLIGLFWITLYSLFGIYLNLYQKSRVRELLLMFLLCIPGVLVIFFTLFLDDQGVNEYQDYYQTLGAYFGIQLFCASFSKALVLTYVKKLIKSKKISFNTLLIGSNQRAQETYQELVSINSSLGLRFIGYLHVFDITKNLLVNDLRHFGDLSVLRKLVRRCHIEQIIIAIEPSEHKKIETILSELEEFSHVKVNIIPDMYQVLLGSVKVNHLMGIPLIEIKQYLIPVWQKVLKRIFDIIFSSLALVFGFPLFTFVGIMTKFSSSGPIFYKQERIGAGEQPFKIIKFRSMYTDAEKMGPALSSDNDPRITPWGKFMRKTRLDELPQFVNVLKGDMSVVGPRPERQFFIDQIAARAPHYKQLLKVRPGITSLGQVKYGYAENVDEMVKRLEFDILYLDNISLAMDFRIILYTIVIVIQGRGK